MTPAEIDALLIEPMARAISPELWFYRIGEPELMEKLREPVRLKARDVLTAMRGTLDANGLFIGPKVATDEMVAAAWGSRSAADAWSVMVAAWQRGDGA